MATVVPDFKARRGRPRKFMAPSRSVTLTLPQDVLAALGVIDRDLSRAVVRLAQPELAKRPHPPAEIAAFGTRGVIVVNPTRTLEQRTGVVLVPLTDGRALISFDESLSAADLELRIQDALDDRLLSEDDARIFESIGRILRNARRSGLVTLQSRNIIVLEARRPSRRRKARAATERVPNWERVASRSSTSGAA